jgi:putative IMPACT (imprinted ancient) family translation regulator
MAAETLAAPAQAALEARRSRFLAHAAPVESPEEAMDWLAGRADPQATHNCWAWRIGAAYRFNDDGEPGGSAGRPILAAIDGQGIDRVAVLVVRWYGGTNLGVGGLVRAYGGVAAECLRTAARRPLVAWRDARLQCDFALAGGVHDLLARHGARKTGESFDEHGLHLSLRLPASNYGELADRLRDLSRGAVVLRSLEPDPE